MKILIFSPHYYSLKASFIKGFVQNGCKVLASSFQEQNSKLINYIDVKTSGIPYKLRRHWENNLLIRVQKKYLAMCSQFNPELILIYNNEHIFPDTLAELKKKAKIVFVLGDNPLMSKTDVYNLAILKYADYIVCPDSYWKAQLETLGIKNIFMDFIGSNSDIYCPIEKTKNNYEYDVAFIGRTYRDSDGYKRAMFLSKFAKCNLKVFTHFDIYWEIWLKYFPELKPTLTYLNKPLTNFEVNEIYNKSKIVPVDSNSGLINGIHLRFFDILSSGCLPIIEYKKDYDILFKDCNIPLIKNYEEIELLTNYYIENMRERNELINNLTDVVGSNYTPEKFVKRILTQLFE